MNIYMCKMILLSATMALASCAVAMILIDLIR